MDPKGFQAPQLSGMVPRKHMEHLQREQRTRSRHNLPFSDFVDLVHLMSEHVYKSEIDFLCTYLHLPFQRTVNLASIPETVTEASQSLDVWRCLAIRCLPSLRYPAAPAPARPRKCRHGPRTCSTNLLEVGYPKRKARSSRSLWQRADCK